MERCCVRERGWSEFGVICQVHLGQESVCVEGCVRVCVGWRGGSVSTAMSLLTLPRRSSSSLMQILGVIYSLGRALPRSLSPRARAPGPPLPLAPSLPLSLVLKGQCPLSTLSNCHFIVLSVLRSPLARWSLSRWRLSLTGAQIRVELSVELRCINFTELSTASPRTPLSLLTAHYTSELERALCTAHRTN